MLEGFFINGALPAGVEHGTYQLPLVVLSYVVASFASYTALALAQQLVDVTNIREKRLFHWGGAFAMGAGIWSMHFIGMLSYKMRMVVDYDPPLTLLSMLIAIAVAYGVLGIVARERLTLSPILFGAVLLGFGICGMHYTGMAAMKMDGDLRYIPSIFFLSVAIAVAASAAALWMAFTLARHSSGYRYLFQPGAALIMGAAICGMHYTGMAAAVFIPYAECRYDPNQNFDMLAFSIAGITAIILGLALATGIYRKTQTEFQLQYSENKLRVLIDNALDAIISMDQQGRITEWNKQAEFIFGWSYQEAVGQRMADMIIPPEYREAHRQGMQRFLANGIGPILNRRIEVPALKQSGKQFPIELTVTAQQLHDTHQFTAFVRDITERKQTEEQLKATLNEVTIAKKTAENALKDAEEAQKKAEVASHAKGDFLANMSHEIRTPLNSMTGTAELLLETELTPQQENHLHTILNSVETLLAIINDILDFSKIESGKLELDAISFDLQAAIEDTVELFAPKTRERECRLELLVHFTPGTPRHVIGDSVRVKQILSNLLSNAIKFTQEGYILVTVEQVENTMTAGKTRIKISVRDTGIGIPADKLQTIFDKFSQADVSTTRKFGGTGLGLAICQQLAGMMHGEVVAQGMSDVGSTFSATMVLERDNAPHKDATAHDRSLLKGKKALIVDDLEPSRIILAAQLASVGIESASAYNANAALKMLTIEKESGIPFDLLVTDYNLPEMVSEVFTQQAKALFPAMPIVMVTGLAERGYAQMFASAGCDAYLTKPVRGEQFLDLLAMIFEAKHSGRTLSMLTPFNMFNKGRVRRHNDDIGFLEGAEILLVEDNRPNRDLIVKLLESLRCRPTAVRNGEEAIEMVSKQSFDLILMDCQMPEMDGFEASTLLREMKKRGDIADMPIIALTANAMKGDREKCLESGMNDYVTKPLRKTKLHSMLTQWLPPKGKRVANRSSNAA